MKYKTTLLLALTALSPPAPALDTYEVEIWARASFGTDGAIAALEFPNDQAHPKLFLDMLREKLSKARIDPPEIDGTPATFKTGILVFILVNRQNSNSNFRIVGIRPSPLLISQTFDRLPGSIFESGAQLTDLKASCLVQVSGRCKDIKVTRPGTPDQIKAFVRNSLEQWHFEPQEINGIRIESEYRAVFKFVSGQ